MTGDTPAPVAIGAMKTVGLNLLERIVLLQVLPTSGTYATGKMVEGMRKKLAPSEAENIEFEIKENKELGTTSWNAKGQEERPFEFGELATAIISKTLKELDKNEKLEQKHLSIYDKFVEK